MISRRYRFLVIFALIITGFLFTGEADASSTMVYFGDLTEDGIPASGVFDIQFKLFDAPAEGVQISQTIYAEGVEIENGSVNVPLEFGKELFADGQKYLEIAIKKPAEVEYTILSPRQILSAYSSDTEPDFITQGPYDSEYLRLDGTNCPFTGYLGIGTGSPSSLVSVVSSDAKTEFLVDNNGAVGDSVFKIRLAGSVAYMFGVDDSDGDKFKISSGVNLGQNDMLTLDQYGRLGIGTSSPLAELHISADDAKTEFIFENSAADGDLGLKFKLTGSSAWLFGVDDSDGDKLKITTNSNFGSGEQFVLARDGKVGIGTSSPTTMLEVAGETKTNALNIAGGSDLSERFDIQAGQTTIRPGVVVCIDPENAGNLLVADRSYDRRVAGVVSGAGGLNPGMVMGQSGSVADGAYPVALSGRVYCLANAEYGAIRAGDLLTTSKTPGHAMKVRNHRKAQGAIIGKAMTDLEDGRGLVLVLVSLQ